MKISVAMTVCNGEKYIIPQLDSIRKQTRHPDEVIICDDVSTDLTPELIQNFIKGYGLVNWRFIENTRQLGWKENFRKAIENTSGDIIFFADQDDVWRRDKIAVMSDYMLHYDAGCLFGGYLVIDGDGRRNKKREIQAKYTGQLKKITFSHNFFNINPLGCCMAVQRRVIDRYLEIDYREDDHDSQCSRIALLYDSLYELDRPVIYYRIHGKNTSGSGVRQSYGASNLEDRIYYIKVKKRWMEIVEKDSTLNETQRGLLKKGIDMETMRINYLEGKKNSIIMLLANYRYYRGISQLVGDFAYKHHVNEILGGIKWNLDKLKGKISLIKG